METFVFHIKWQRIMRDFGLSGDDIASVYDALADYVENGSTPCLTETARMAFTFIVNQIDEDKTKYNEVRAKRSEAGKKGMQHRYQDNANDNKSNKTNKCYQDETNITSVTDNVYVYNKEKTISKEIVKKKATKVATLTERKEIFKSSLEPYLAKYSREMLNDFYVYWTEENQTGTKMRFELEKTWGLGGRLATWAKRENNFKTTSNGNTLKSYQQIEREHRAKQHSDFAQDIIRSLGS